MFDYLEPDADGALNQLFAPGDAFLPLPPRGRSPGKSSQPPRPERLRHLLYGSLPALERTIKIFHAQGYADPNAWSPPAPVLPAEPQSASGVDTWMVVLTKTLLIE
jgi:hypothetical protein